jgi:hypothetical protein
LNRDYRCASAPRAVWEVSAGPDASGYFILEYATTGRVNGTLALDISSYHTSSCNAILRHMLLFEFLDLNNEIARRFVSGLQIRINGMTDTIKIRERLHPETSQR